MRLLGPSSLQARLLAGVLGSLVIAWAAAALVTWKQAELELDALLDAHLAQAAALLVVQELAEPGGDQDDQVVDAPTLHRYAPQVAFQVFHDGQLVVHSINAPQAPLAQGSEGFSDSNLDGSAWRVFTAVGAERDVWVHVGERRDSRALILRRLLEGLLMPLALALPALGALTAGSLRRGLRPLRVLADQLAGRDADDLRPMMREGATAETAAVMDELDVLFARIAALLDGERRFTADAAHELRTPIAAIRVQAQVALHAENDIERRHALKAMLSGCDRAGRLVEQLLILARLEAGGGVPSDSPTVDLCSVARSELAEAAPKAIARRQVLRLQADGEAGLQGDETLLAVLLRNLIDNALRYAPEGAKVHVTVRVEDARAEVIVEDSGPGLPPQAWGRLGERFFRPGGQIHGGSGLGWSIVRRIAAVHGLTVTVDRSPRLGGLRVCMFGPSKRVARRLDTVRPNPETA